MKSFFPPTLQIPGLIEHHSSSPQTLTVGALEEKKELLFSPAEILIIQAWSLLMFYGCKFDHFFENSLESAGSSAI